MEKLDVYEAKIHLPKLLERVAGGERITITRHGVPVAILQPLDYVKKSPPKEIIAELRKFRDKHKLDGLSLKKVIEEGRS